MAKVGKKTGKKTQAGKDVYKTPEGKNVSEISSTFEYKGKWINVPSIHKGYEYDDDTLRLMLEAEVIRPTSVHDSRKEAEAAARDRSDRLKFDEGGLAEQTDTLFGYTAEGARQEGERLRTDVNTDLTFKDAATAVARSKKLFNKYKWPIIDVSRKSVEETAASILKIYEISKNK